MGPNCGKCMEAEGVEQQKQAPAADRHAIPSPRQARGGGGTQSEVQALQIPSPLGLSAPVTCGAASKLTLPFWGEHCRCLTFP
jgi:hypothetical protein